MRIIIRFRRALRPLIIVLSAMLPLQSRAQYIHLDVSAGIQYFDGMTQKIGWDYNIGGRLLFNDRWFLGALIHQGINNGKYDGIYAGEPARLDHNRTATLFAIGPGYMHMLDERVMASAQLLAGYGTLETDGNPKVKEPDDVESHSFKKFSCAAVLGLDYILDWIVIGTNLTTHYIDGHVMPSVNLKFGFYFVL